MARRTLVTGGSGFIGTNVVEALRRRLESTGDALLAIDSQPPCNAANAAVHRHVDICDRAALQAVFDDFRPDAVIHLAARTDLLGTSLADYAANTDGTANLLGVLETQPQVTRTLYASSMLVCRLGYRPASVTDYAPNTAYGASKVAAETMVRAADPGRRRIVLCRPTSIWGPWFGEPYRNFFDAVVGGYYVHPKGASTQRSYGYVGNAVAQINALMAAPSASLADQVYHLADYEPTNIGEWADMIASASGRRRPLRVPLPLLRGAALAGDALKALGWSRPPITRFRLSNMLTDAVLDTGPMRALCPDLPVSTREGVDRTVAWMSASRH